MRPGIWAGAAPALLALAADASPFAALGGQDVGVAGVGVAPAQVLLEFAGQHGVAGMIRAAHDKGADWTELRLGLSHDVLTGVKHSSTFSRLAQRLMAGVLLADRLSMFCARPGYVPREGGWWLAGWSGGGERPGGGDLRYMTFKVMRAS
jgi:hypothetical protein